MIYTLFLIYILIFGRARKCGLPYLPPTTTHRELHRGAIGKGLLLAITQPELLGLEFMAQELYRLQLRLYQK